jgi:Tol biopolymer transport system component
MQHDERVRTLIERGLSSGPAAQPHPDDLLSRLRRRRMRRRALNSAVVVVVAAGVLVPILMLKGMGHPPAQSLGGRVGGYGISLRLPSGWHARTSLSPGRGPVVIFGTADLPPSVPPGAAISVRQPTLLHGPAGATLFELFEFPPGPVPAVASAFPPLAGKLSLPTGLIHGCNADRYGCARRRFSIAGRNFLLVATLRTVQASADQGVAVAPIHVISKAVFTQAEAALATLQVSRSGYELGASCRPQGTNLRIVTASNGQISWAPSCLAAPANRAFTITFRNRLATTAGQQGIPAGVDILTSEAFAYEPSTVQSGSPDPQKVVLLGKPTPSPSRAVYHVGPLSPGIYFVGFSGGFLQASPSVLIVGGVGGSTADLTGSVAYKCADSICIVNADGTGQRDLIPNGARPWPQWDPAWSPDGTTLAFRGYYGLGDGQYDLYTIGADGCGLTRLTNGRNGTSPTWSPDGRQVAFASGAIWVINSDGSSLRRLTSADPRTGLVDAAPSWSNDRIAFVGFPAHHAFDPHYGQIYWVSPDGVALVQLTHGPGGFGEPSWSPSGRQLAFVGYQGRQSQIYVMNADGSGLRHLTHGHDRAWNPVWPPGGGRVAFLAQHAGTSTLWVMNADGSHRQTLSAAKGALQIAWGTVGSRSKTCP